MNTTKIANLKEIDINDLYRQVKSENPDRIGCIVSFTGIVRENTNGRITREVHLGLDQSTEGKLKEIADEASKHRGILNILIYHNIDDIKAGDEVVYILVAAQHRKEGFAALEDIIDRIKKEVHVDLIEKR